jgi:hypothetical protein
MCRSRLSNARQSYQLPQPAYALKPAILQAASHKTIIERGLWEPGRRASCCRLRRPTTAERGWSLQALHTGRQS